MAATYYRRALELNPALADKFIEQGKTAFQADNFKDAIEPLTYTSFSFQRTLKQHTY